MALVPLYAKLLLDAKARGARFDRTLTLSRQHWLVDARSQAELVAGWGLPAAAVVELKHGGFADAFFHRGLGAAELVALDASAFEGADRLHDLNRPVPAEWHGQFDAVVDGGTLEHIFNFPVALESCLRMLKVGGRMYWGMPANNHCGHGFYQFSPELVFRVFGPSSGFRIERFFLGVHPFPGTELSPRMDFYEVCDPDEVRGRVAFVNDRPTVINVIAVKERMVDPFGRSPQQSDYERIWAEGKSDVLLFGSPDSRRAVDLSRTLIRLANRLPLPLRNWLAGQYQRRFLCTLRNRRHFKPVAQAAPRNSS